MIVPGRIPQQVNTLYDIVQMLLLLKLDFVILPLKYFVLSVGPSLCLRILFASWILEMSQVSPWLVNIFWTYRNYITIGISQLQMLMSAASHYRYAI